MRSDPFTHSPAIALAMAEPTVPGPRPSTEGAHRRAPHPGPAARRRSRHRCLAVALGMAVLAAACAGGGAEAGEGPTGGPSAGEPGQPGDTAEPGAVDPHSGFPVGWEPEALVWSPCDLGDAEGEECAALTVPLDWADPGGEQIELALGRVPARGEPRGSLVMNPGGPGGSGLQLVGRSPVSPDLEEAFDLVSWDPRGVGESTAVGCNDHPLVAAYRETDPTPDDDGEQAALEAASLAAAYQCQESDGELLAHVHTEEVARDLEAVRLALGDEPLNYLGFSYGTEIGQHYAELFGSEVRAMALDGVADPSLDREEFIHSQLRSFDAAFTANVEACAAAGVTECGVPDLAASYDAVAQRLEQERLPGGPDDIAPNGVGPYELVSAAYTSASRDAWADLGHALADALDGDGGGLWGMAARSSGSYGLYTGVVCSDSQHATDIEGYHRFYERAVEVSPRFGPGSASEVLDCIMWGVEPRGTDEALTAPDAPPILLVGTTGDPATPFEQAEAVAESLTTATLVVADMDRHIAYGYNPCVTDLVGAYLLDLAVPEAGTTC